MPSVGAPVTIQEFFVPPASFPIGTVTASLAVTESDDALTAASSSLITATAALAEAADGVSSTASSITTAALALTEAADTLVATTTSVSGASLTITEAADTLTSVSSVVVRLTAAITEASDQVVSAAGGVTTAAASLFEAPDALAAIARPVTGLAAALLEAPDILGSVAVGLLTASLAVTESPDALAAQARPPIVAQGTITEQSDTVTAHVTTSMVSVLVSAALTVLEASDVLGATLVTSGVAPLPEVPRASSAYPMVAIDNAYGSDLILRNPRQAKPVAKLGLGAQVLLSFGQPGGQLTNIRVELLKPGGKVPTSIRSPFTQLGAHDMPSGVGTYVAGSYVICVVSPGQLDTVGPWKLTAASDTAVSAPGTLFVVE